MRHKILTVDDSKTVRIIIKKAFTPFDVEIVEAANGVEGLAVAARETPHLILLDVTMPVMDGVEMLTKLKADPALKGIPVIMLTAEGGRDNVLKTAKIGIRDYVIKPFKEEVLIEKVGRVIDLKPVNDGQAKAKTITDPIEILLFDDKPAIVQQIQDGLKHTPWSVTWVSSQNQAMDAITGSPPDLMIVSLSLTDDTAFNFFRAVRSNPKTKYTPVFALAVKTETAQQQQAQTAGFSSIVTKPIDILDLETRIARAMNLDMSQRYYAFDGNMLVMRLPEGCSLGVLAEVSSYLKPKLTEAVDSGFSKAVIDLRQVKALHMGIIKMLMQSMQTCRDLGMQLALVGSPQIISECKGIEDTRDWTFYHSLEDARMDLGRSPSSPALAGA
jgi:two-component system cell cycle response regulator